MHMFLKLISSEETYSIVCHSTLPPCSYKHIDMFGFGLILFYQEQTKHKKDHTRRIFQEFAFLFVCGF